MMNKTLMPRGMIEYCGTQLDSGEVVDWGLLGPEHLAGQRRTRALGLGAAVRKFNQLAVPGLGGVWFAKQLALATLGVAIADRLRLSSRNIKTIEVANAIEALGCWCAFEANGWQRDPRLRGVQKLRNKAQFTFAQLRQPRSYVTQPMRMATVEPLVDLGFVLAGSQRFNSFHCTDAGQDLVTAGTNGFRPDNAALEDYLVRLATTNEPIRSTPRLRQGLSQLEPLPPAARDLLRSRLCLGAGDSPNASRRKNALAWLSSNPTTDWNQKPVGIDPDHWDDLRLGARFFVVRDAAIELLNAIEDLMAKRHLARFPVTAAVQREDVQRELDHLEQCAGSYLGDRTRDPTEAGMATSFCRACTDEDPAQVVRFLTRRDDRVLLLRGDEILRGPAFDDRAHAADAEEDAQNDPQEDAEGPGAENARRVPVPEGISPRIRNLYLLQLDLTGNLGAFLAPPARETAP